MSYHVFLSFRGPDIRNNFLSHLYTALDQTGIYTYIDSEELRKGEPISPALMKAIEDSRIAIVIFSENYAFSTWCLEEVAKIMECKAHKDLIVLPVFYKVEPREVRGGRKSYGIAMDKHESKFGKDLEIVKGWRNALFATGSLSGWELNDGDEAKLIKRILEEISMQLDRTPLHVAKHPVGIHPQVGTNAVKAIVLDLPKLEDIYIGPNAFANLRRLRMFIMVNVHNSFQGPICLPNELRWFEWPKCPWMPKFFSGSKKLVGLDLHKSNILVVGEQFQDFKKLRFINFSECESLVCLPDLSCTPNLEELDLHDCKHLVEAHKSVAYHEKLRLLNLYGCKELSVFSSVLKSKSLRYLNLTDCSKLEMFPNIPDKMEAMQELQLKGTAVRQLPASIINLVSLWLLELDKCKNLTTLPSSIYKLQKLKRLSIQGCSNLVEFPKYEENSNDSHVKMGFPNLFLLRLGGCNLSGVEFLENLFCFPKLECLSLKGNNFTSLPTSIKQRHCLGSLDVSNCRRLREIPELPPLHVINAGGCESLHKIPDLPSATTYVGLNSCDELVGKGLTMTHVLPLEALITKLREDGHGEEGSFFLPGGEMPEWLLPVEGNSTSFMASRHLYDKFLGFAFCFIYEQGRGKEFPMVEIRPHINGKEGMVSSLFIPYDQVISDHVCLAYFKPRLLWERLDFGQADLNHFQFSFIVHRVVLAKWGFRIMCEHLEDDLKAMIPDNERPHPALLYEVGHKCTRYGVYHAHVSTKSKEESSGGTDLQEKPPEPALVHESSLASRALEDIALAQRNGPTSAGESVMGMQDTEAGRDKRNRQASTTEDEIDEERRQKLLKRMKNQERT